MSEVESRQLRYFVAVAEELHFGRAAERLGMAQPPLSRAIRELERTLEVQLFERTTRRVDLTAAGEVLLREARTALQAMSAAARRAQHAGRSTPVLRVALKADYDAGLLPGVVAAYRREEAALPVDLVLGGREEQAPALRDGRADVALLVVPAGFDDSGLDLEHLVTEPRLVALSADDPLASRPSLRLADFAGRLLPDGSLADQDGAAPARPTDAGDRRERQLAEPAPVAGAPSGRLDLAQIFNLIELGRMVWFPPVSVARRHPGHSISYRAVEDLEPATFAVAWPQDSRSPAAAAFVRAATAVAQAASPARPPAPLTLAPVLGRAPALDRPAASTA